MTHNFLESESANDDIDNCFAILGIPSDVEKMFRTGTEKSPKVLRESSLIYSYPKFEGLYSPEFDEFILTKKKIYDLGDIVKAKNESKANYDNKIKKQIQILTNKNIIPVCLGGNHSITLPIIKGFHETLSVIHFDAHSDYMSFYDVDATPNGVVMRKVNNLNHVEQIIHVGIRGYLNSSKAIRQTKLDGNILITSKQLREQGIDVLINNLNNKKKYYITFDTDFLDPVYCPGTSTPEPGGISFLSTEEILTKIGKNYKVLGMDFVEYNPLYDQSRIGGFHISRLIISLMGAIK